METILIIQFMILYSLLIIGTLLWVVNDIKDAIKKYKEEKAKNQ